MTDSIATSAVPLPLFTKQTLVKGQPATIECVEVEGHTLVVEGRLLTKVSVEDEWFEDLESPQTVITTLKSSMRTTPDLLTFWQRMPHTEPRHAYRTEWEELELETAMDMIAERLIAAREDGWQETDDEGHRVDRTMGFAHLGGATLDNEENYLIKKAFTAMGAVQIENQARI